MIVVESILTKIFNQLPDVVVNSKNYKPTFGWGNKDELNLVLSNKTTTNKYPIIWLLPSELKGSEESREKTRECTFIIAINTKYINNTNPIIWLNEIETILNPLCLNIITAFNKSGVTRLKNDSLSLSDYPKHSESDKSFTIDNWTAKVLKASIIFEENSNFTEKCINTIKF